MARAYGIREAIVTSCIGSLSELKLPQPGDRLVHTFRKSQRQVVAEVILVDEKTLKVAVRVGAINYSSLSAAAEAQTGHHTNGWIFWGLKKMGWRPRGD